MQFKIIIKKDGEIILPNCCKNKIKKDHQYNVEVNNSNIRIWLPVDQNNHLHLDIKEAINEKISMVFSFINKNLDIKEIINKKSLSIFFIVLCLIILLYNNQYILEVFNKIQEYIQYDGISEKSMEWVKIFFNIIIFLSFIIFFYIIIATIVKLIEVMFTVIITIIENVYTTIIIFFSFLFEFIIQKIKALREYLLYFFIISVFIYLLLLFPFSFSFSSSENPPIKDLNKLRIRIKPFSFFQYKMTKITKKIKSQKNELIVNSCSKSLRALKKGCSMKIFPYYYWIYGESKIYKQEDFESRILEPDMQSFFNNITDIVSVGVASQEAKEIEKENNRAYERAEILSKIIKKNYKNINFYTLNLGKYNGDININNSFSTEYQRRIIIIGLYKGKEIDAKSTVELCISKCWNSDDKNFPVKANEYLKYSFKLLTPSNLKKDVL